MVDLGQNIFCRSNVLRRVRSASQSGTGAARRLMHGVFNPASVQNTTLTGRRVMNQGTEKRNEPMRPLNNISREVIKGELSK